MKTLASTATPSAPPTSRIALLAPLALPSSLRRTLERIMLETGAKTSAMPMPGEHERARSGCCRRPSGEDTAASQPSAIACRARPVAISGRLPMRSENMPASGAMNIGISVQGSVRTPASKAE